MTGDAWIETVRIARDFGTVDLLFPPGVTDLRDIPHTLFDAIRAGLLYLDLQDLPPDDRPPRRIWGDTEKLMSWLEGHDESPTEQVYIEGPVERNAAAAMLISD